MLAPLLHAAEKTELELDGLVGEPISIVPLSDSSFFVQAEDYSRALRTVFLRGTLDGKSFRLKVLESHPDRFRIALYDAGQVLILPKGSVKNVVAWIWQGKETKKLSPKGLSEKVVRAFPSSEKHHVTLVHEANAEILHEIYSWNLEKNTVSLVKKVVSNEPIRELNGQNNRSKIEFIREGKIWKAFVTGP